jgi:alpha-D-xyloside xylohydrolase
MKRLSSLFVLLFALDVTLAAQFNPINPVHDVQQRADRVVFPMQSGSLQIVVCSDSILHVLYSPTGNFPEMPHPAIVKTAWGEAAFTMQQTEKEVTVATARMRATVSLADGVVTFKDAGNRKLAAEGPHLMRPAKVNGEDMYRSEAVFNIYGSHEALYGLGQHQAGVWNYRGESVDLSQDNTNISVPLMLSSNGYGIYWNNDSRGRMNNRFANYLFLSSEAADTIDYYFIYGPEFDSIIAGYRELTGAAPLYGKWAYGFWQSKNKYNSQQELLDVAKRYRAEHIPVDNIVQDWFWWTNMGDFHFDPKRYPDPKGMVDQLHGEHFHIMFSIWPYFYPGSDVYAEMDKLGYFIDRTKSKAYHPQGMAVYDATNPAAGAYYWNLVNKSLLSIGADAFWMDTTEPETEGQEENVLTYNKLALGNGARYANLYPLATTGVVYDGQRKVSDKERVYILSRSAYAGDQRYGVTAWSGDLVSDWETFKRQIPAGLNFELSGIPYWTTDIGGFVSTNPNSPAYRELYVRWFEYGTFCPIFRTHGTRTTNQNELWSYGPEAQKILVAFDKLRYQLIPYIYSVAWKTTSESYTPMRPLVMDFREDTRAQNIGDEFLFGPSILVAPVTEPDATTRHLYLPKGLWYDFWSGAAVQGGQAIDAAAPLERIPLYVRAGAIVPLGPDMEYAAEKPADPIELRVYKGADGAFTLYEDENDSYNYEKGLRATIPIRWDNGAQSLTIDERVGTFPGMLTTRTFHVTGPGLTSRDVTYSGRRVSVTLR